MEYQTSENSTNICVSYWCVAANSSSKFLKLEDGISNNNQNTTVILTYQNCPKFHSL